MKFIAIFLTLIYFINYIWVYNKKLLDIPNQMFILESSLIDSLNTIGTRDLACLKSLEMLNTCCKHNVIIKHKW